jgi:GPH family glycoside/pentoside/hexuronide:cation symporter
MGLFNSGCYLNIYAMLTDLVELDRRSDGVSRAGLYSGLFTAGDKIAFAVGGTLLAGSILGAAGFVPGGASQSPGAEAGIAFAFAVVPATLFLLTCGIILLMMREPRMPAPQPA